MKRTFTRGLSKAAVLTHYLQSVKPASVDWTNEIQLLQREKIIDLAAWKALSQECRNRLHLSPSVVKVLDDGAQVCTEGGKRIAILYGSQTGTAESYAKMLGTYAISHGLEPRVASMNDGLHFFESNTDLPDAVIFVCSTYGNGEFPSNAKTFMQVLTAGKLPQLASIPHSIFGLGNSHNDNFNAAAKALSSKLKEIGSPSLVRMQLSCELQQSGHDGAYRSWKRAVWKSLGVTGEGTRAFKPTYSISECLTSHADEHIPLPGFIPAVVHGNASLTPVGYQPQCRMLRFSVDCSTQMRTLGRVGNITDHVQIFPSNSAQLVQRMLRRLNLNGNSVVEITPLAGAPHHPYDFKKLRIETVLSEVVDLSCVPSRSMLETMSLLTNNSSDREKLERIAGDLSVGGSFDTLSQGVFTVVDAFEMFPSVNATLPQLLTLLPHIAPRSYSIACDNTSGNHAAFDVLYSIPTREVEGRHHEGLCTGMLNAAQPGDKIRVHFHPSGIALPRDDAPCVIVALGTGIGSAHAILQHRLQKLKDGFSVGKAHLFYGMRHKTKDCFFQSDFAVMEACGMLTVTYVASHDGPTFTTPFDVMDRSLIDFLGNEGHIAYCGLGGSVPLRLESTLRRIGFDVSEMRKQGRLHEEFFTVDTDSENLFKNRSVDESSSTLVGRMGNCDMFCFQCEQTFKGKGCHKVGVCGKTPRVAALQDLTVHAMKILGFYANETRLCGGDVPDAINRFTLYALFSTLTNVNFDESRFEAIVKQSKTYIDEMKSLYSKVAASKGLATKSPQKSKELPTPLPSLDGLVELGRSVGVLNRFVDPATQNAAGVSEMVVYGLKGIAAYADHSLMNGKELPEIYEFIHRALSFMTSEEQYDLSKGLAFALEAGKINVSTMGLLYDSNASLGIPTPTTVPVKPSPGKSILVSGHDLIILKALLEKTEPLGINVFTHGEMLPAHSYPKLKAHTNLKGHFGGAWMRQGIEFPHFPGPILMTTNCLTEPHETYSAHLFTAGAVGWKGIPHIGNTIKDIDFDLLIKSALEAKGFGEEKAFNYADPVGVRRPEALTVGFGHETILSVAPTILKEIKKGNITRFFVVGGCDGYEGERSYYTDLVSRLPKTAVVLTVGCGKFRINHLNLGTIGETGIPRILDMGQCNDSFSAVQVALALAKALNCQVSDLPLSIVLSWFEQKAIAVLLSCLALGLKPIHVGPALPAFITPDVLNVLVKDFGVLPLGDVNKDLEAMLAAPGAS